MLTALVFNTFAQTNDNLFIGDKAPKFVAESTKGKINFPDDYFGKWKIIFSHPADFTPVCSSEILELALLQADFKKLNTAILVLSTDGLNSHIEWIKSLESINYKGNSSIKIDFPLISDVGLEISKKYGMIGKNSNSTRTIRTVFIIDPTEKIRAMFYYPLEVGRNIDEIKRTLMALQEVDKSFILTPANWNSGDDCLLPAPSTMDEAEKLKEKNDKNLRSLSWYMWYKKMN